MKLELAESIHKLVSSKYVSAKSSGSLVFSPTELAIIRSCSGVPFQIRYCPALSKKPSASTTDSKVVDSQPKLNPFENPAESLLVARLPNDRNATHHLVLNKYPVIARHSIVSTIGFKSQTDFLDGSDLEVTYSCLQAWEAESTEPSSSRLFAFFNSGEHSGASQPHRHLQLLPIEDMMGPGSLKAEWEPLIDLMTEPLPEHLGVFHNPSLPFRHYAMEIPANPDTGVLQQIYRRLCESATKAVLFWDDGRPLGHTAVGSNGGQASISYNLGMTTHAMAICPRRSETAVIPTSNGEGSTAVNGTVLGGTLMVKDLCEWEALQQNQVVVDNILTEIGIPSWSSSESPLSTRL